ncbi:transketolase [Nemorincola caseinilytica]|uniref:Transketolase n=1 Tax=Nemorincola caseinilytica TaxID=2054315 RepID=A0ABP8N9M0_9BACT
MTEKEHINLQGRLRLKILGLHHGAGSGHIGCSLSCIDIMISVLKYKGAEDSFILSKGHAATALYTILNETGGIPDDAMDSFYKNDTTLPAHPAPGKYDAIPFATGSLGHGLPIATGIAKANKLKKSKGTSYVLMSDGETNEGTTWEAAHFAVANRLDNLLVLVDKNGLQGFGSTKDILGDTASGKIWETMGFDVREADGHDIGALLAAKNELLALKNGRPKLVIANTVKGKGVPYMENKMEWHYLPMNEQLYTEAIERIKLDYRL